MVLEILKGKKMAQTGHGRTTLLKIFKGTPGIFIGNNVNPCPIDQTCISLDNKQEIHFFLLSLQILSKYWIKKVFNKTISAQVHGSNFVIFNFPEITFFLELCRIFGIC